MGSKRRATCSKETSWSLAAAGPLESSSNKVHQRPPRTRAAKVLKASKQDKSETDPRETGKVENALSFSCSGADGSERLGVNLPCEVSLNVAPFEAIAPYISGPLIVTRVPNEVRALGPTARVARLYREFGHVVASRKDWCGVYVLTESSVFRRQSRLAWEVLSRFTDQKGQKCQLLRWSPDRPHGHGGSGSVASQPLDSEGHPHRLPAGKGVAWERAPRRRTIGRHKIKSHQSSG
eukprot:TRINITY_DN21245_c0_g2_i2.p1 TRINITY_DN21245_c0_g2~~TRINITY_DN21245_c0_g2_i2.p1  ORF type:complete len:236 (-),score=31.39 TRINITY_DN21245_c0_g2_i2:122-829(-)